MRTPALSSFQEVLPQVRERPRAAAYTAGSFTLTVSAPAV